MTVRRPQVAANRSTGALDFIDADGRTLARIEAATAPIERRFPHGYADIGWPFLPALGRAALEIDVARPRAQRFAALGADGRFSP